MSAVEFTTQEWIEAKPEDFDNTERFAAEVFPLIEALEAKCSEIGCPLAVRVVVKQENGTSHSSFASWLGGPGRATPEIMAINLMETFDAECLATLRTLGMFCAEKYTRNEK